MPQPRKYANDAERQKAYRERQAQLDLEKIYAATPGASIPVPGTYTVRRWNFLLEAATRSLETVRDEMQAYADTHDRGWHFREKGVAVNGKIALLTEVIERLKEP